MSKSTFVRRQGRGPTALLSVAALAATGLVAAAVPAGAAVTAGGQADANGRPGFVRDADGIALALCTDAVNCEPADPADPLHGGYFSAEATVGGIRAVFAIETAAGEDAAGNPTDQATVANVAVFDGDGLRPGARYTIRHPWGSSSVVADDRGRVRRVIEAGGEAGTALGSGVVKTFLRRVNAPAGFLGNLDAAGRVTGSPTGFNAVQVTGPGVNATARNFIVNGQMRANTAMTSVSTGALKLGSVKKATPSTAPIPVTSFGTANATFTVTKSGANPGAFRVQTPAAVASGSAGTISVTYTPKANRDASAVLTIDDNGLAAPRKVTLTGVANDTRAPKVLASTPARGAANVAAGKSVKVKFSEAVVSAKTSLSLVDAAGNKVGAKVSRVGKTNTYLVNPGRALAHGAKYTVKVNGGKKALRDLAGNAAKDTRWSFRTR